MLSEESVFHGVLGRPRDVVNWSLIIGPDNHQLTVLYTLNSLRPISSAKNQYCNRYIANDAVRVLR